MLGRFNMQVLSIQHNTLNQRDFQSENPVYGHSHKSIKKNGYKPSQKAVITGTTALGVIASLAILAKCAKYSLKPSKMFKDIKSVGYSEDVVFSSPYKEEFKNIESKKILGISVIDFKDRSSISEFEDEYQKFLIDGINKFIKYGYKIRLFAFFDMGLYELFIYFGYIDLLT